MKLGDDSRRALFLAYSYIMTHISKIPRKLKRESLRFASFIVQITLTAACLAPETEIDTEIDTAALVESRNDASIESWGAFEHTHSAYRSAMISGACPPESDSIRYIDPIPKLVELARQHNVVMINEAHYKPIHRAFIGELAKALRAIDYNSYGAETFAASAFSHENRNLELISRGYPVLTDGFYTTEPIYGQLVETVIENGYVLFSYEYTTPLPSDAVNSISHRDKEQAKNILSELLVSPQDKVLIHAGYDHVRERLGARDQKWMAQYFKESSGIDPLTINQTDCFSDQAYDAGVLGYAMPVNAQGQPVTYKGFDVLLIPPKETQYRDRPVWLRDYQGRRFVDVPLKLQFNDQYTRVTARNVERVEDAVVEDTIYRPPHADKPLALRPGSYRLEVTNKDKKVLAQENITVP